MHGSGFSNKSSFYDSNVDSEVDIGQAVKGSIAKKV